MLSCNPTLIVTTKVQYVLSGCFRSACLRLSERIKEIIALIVTKFDQ